MWRRHRIPILMNHRRLAAVLFLLVPALSAQRTIRVPAEQASINAAYAAAVSGDTILVAPGEYRESLLIQGKNVVLRSEEGPARTTIRGNGNQPVLQIQGSAITRATRIEGFTVTGGRGSSEGGGFFVQSGAAPVISRNIIENNTYCGAGGGVACGFASPRIEFNLIRNNRQFGCSGGTGGAGVSVRGSSSAEIVGNIIEDNVHQTSSGGGIGLFASGLTLVQGNLVRRNQAVFAGGIYGANMDAELLIQNIVVENQASRGAGVELGGGATAVRMIGNTIANNIGGSAMFVFQLNSGFRFYNNLIAGSHGTALIEASRMPSTTPQMFHNLLYNDAGPILDRFGPIGGIVGIQGNISADPLFVDAAYGDYHIRLDSPARDAGTQTVPGGLPASDFWGQPRIAGGPVFGQVDIGADEDNGIRPYGRGCEQNSPYLALARTSGGEPRLGNQNFALELRSAKPNANCAIFIGVSRDQWGNLALPWNMASLGMPRCELLTSINDARLASTDASGNATLPYPLPNNPAFQGLRFPVQWLIAGPQNYIPGDLSDAVLIELR
jgi:hypothetical protein